MLNNSFVRAPRSNSTVAWEVTDVLEEEEEEEEEKEEEEDEDGGNETILPS